MSRLTTNNEVSKMGMYELALNSCYIQDGLTRYRDFENDMDARDLARELAWMLADIELSSYDDNFDEEMLENLQYDITKEPIGLIALFYRNLWAMADLREKLKEYEDLEEQGLLLKLPCKVGDKVYSVTRDFISKYIICSIQKYTEGFFFNWKCEEGIYANTRGFTEFEIGKTVFLTKEEAEQKLKEMESDTNGKN